MRQEPSVSASAADDSGDYASGANALHEQIIGSFCHDLRQPLNAALMRLAALKQAYTAGHDSELLDDLHMSLREIANMSETVFDAIRLSRASIRPKLGAVSLAALLERVRSEFTPIAQQKGLRLSICPAPYIVVTDELLLSRILFNLVQNALSYTKDGGILIAARRVSGQLSLEVWDTGPGIRGEQIDAIFQPFYRGGSEDEQAATTRNTGIGLWNGQEFARLLGGTLTVASRYGRGSVFRLRLPVECQEVKRSSEGRAPGVPGPRQMVALLAPDQETLIEQQRLVLARGDTHISFCDPLALLGYLNVPLNRPDALLIDSRVGPVGVDFLAGLIAVRYPELRMGVLAGNLSETASVSMARSGVRILAEPLSSNSLDLFLRPGPAEPARRAAASVLSGTTCPIDPSAAPEALDPAPAVRTKATTELHPGR